MSAPNEKDLEQLKREELDKVAANAGVPDPDSLPNKDAVIDAINAPNPALVAKTAPRVAQTYVVTGPRRVHDTDPGDEFTALFTPEQEAALITAGHINPSQSAEPS